MTETVARTWSPESEQALLGCLLFDGALFDRVGDLVARGDFFDSRNGTIFAAVAGLAMSCKPVDPVAVFDVLSETGKAEECGGLSYLLDLVGSSPSLKGVRQYAVRVREKAVQRSLMAAASEAYNIAAEAGELTDKVERIGALFAGIQRQTVRKAPAGMDQLAVRAIDRYTELNKGKLASAVSTGLTDLDRTLNGGLRGGKLYGIAARPSVGKSSVARFIGLSVAGAGVPTLLLSQEMSGDEVADCVVSQLGRVDSERLQTGKLTGDDWGCVTEAIERMTRLPFHVDDQGGLTLNDIRTKARLVKGLGCLILDYLQLTGHTQKGMNRNNQIEEVSRGLKALSLELNIPILVLSQLNRDVEARKDKEPMLSDLRDSGAIEQDLDVAIMLWTVREFGERRIVGCSVPKHRGGRKGRFALEFRPAVHQWSASDASIDPPTATERRGREL